MGREVRGIWVELGLCYEHTRLLKKERPEDSQTRQLKVQRNRRVARERKQPANKAVAALLGEGTEGHLKDKQGALGKGGCQPHPQDKTTAFTSSNLCMGPWDSASFSNRMGQQESSTVPSSYLKKQQQLKFPWRQEQPDFIRREQESVHKLSTSPWRQTSVGGHSRATCQRPKTLSSRTLPTLTAAFLQQGNEWSEKKLLWMHSGDTPHPFPDRLLVWVRVGHGVGAQENGRLKSQVWLGPLVMQREGTRLKTARGSGHLCNSD